MSNSGAGGGTPVDEKPEAAPPTVKEKKKVPKEKKKPKPKAPAHPPYLQMIKEAITALNEKGGSSPYAIAKYTEEKHKSVLPVNFRKILGLQLKNSVTKGKLIKTKASYKLSEAGKREKTSTISPITKAVRANAAKPKETDKKRKPKLKEISKIENTTGTAQPIASTRGHRSKRSAPVKPKQLKSIKSTTSKKVK